MDIFELIKDRHSVRRYQDIPIPQNIISELKNEVSICNDLGGLNIQLVTDEPQAFKGFLAHYGIFSGVTNYFALIGPDDEMLDEKCGYYGERLVLKAQELGLNTCWVAATYKKVPEAYTIGQNERLCLVIALGYGKDQGKSHRSKPLKSVCSMDLEDAAFIKGIEAALLAPTAINQQKFFFTYTDGKVHLKAGSGRYTKVDKGIVKYHFEAVSGMKVES
ncbi:MAG: nitroreductase [Christensenellaceae bacterium]|nr:nitroreductase [Christensenellaceae bacterium]